MATQSPLKLERYGIFSFSFKLREEIFGDGEKPYSFKDMELAVSQGVKRNGNDESLYLVELKISVREKENSFFPYRIHMRIWGLFSVASIPGLSAQNACSIAAINGSSILYGLAREYIFMATCHCINGSFCLPTVSFIPKKEGKQTLLAQNLE